MQSYGWNLQRLQHSRNYNSTPVCRTLGRRPEALVLLNSAKAYTGEHLNTHSEDIVAYCEHLERFTFVLLMLQRAIGGRWSQCQRAGRYAVQWGKHCIIIIINEYCYSAWSQKKLQEHLTHTHPWALFPGLPGCAGTRKVKPIWILLKQETVSGSGISWAICKSAPHSRHTTMPAPHHSVVYRPDALPAAQPTASKH